MKFNKLMLLAFVLCLSAMAFAQNNEKTLTKPWQSWSQNEAQKIIMSKPFADQFQSPAGLASSTALRQAQGQADTRLSGQERGRSNQQLAPPVLTVRLHSALPMRQAIIRLQQIGAGYDKMNEEQRKKFDESTKVFLDCAICKEYYVVTLAKSKDTSEGVDDGMFQTMTFEDLKGKITLVNDKGEKRDLAQFNPPKSANDYAVFFFKRTDANGNHLITPETKEFRFVFGNELLDNNNRYSSLIPRTFDFKVSKLIFNDKVEF